MAMLYLSCSGCGHEWGIWRQYQATLDRIKYSAMDCPGCGRPGGHERKTYPAAVHYKGEGWTPKSGTVNDLRDLDIPEKVRKELD